jgi:hypothetical protein
MKRFAVVSRQEPAFGDCPRCRRGNVVDRESAGGKCTRHCTFCGRYTKGHNKALERGHATPAMRRITNLRPLRHIYGRSYFGSGGAYGRVCCDGNCEPVGTKDNGFVSGPAAVRVKDWRKPAHFTASGGDAIGSGREWTESGWWNPATREWL